MTQGQQGLGMGHAPFMLQIVCFKRSLLTVDHQFAYAIERCVADPVGIPLRCGQFLAVFVDQLAAQPENDISAHSCSQKNHAASQGGDHQNNHNEQCGNRQLAQGLDNRKTVKPNAIAPA